MKQMSDKWERFICLASERMKEGKQLAREKRIAETSKRLLLRVDEDESKANKSKQERLGHVS